MDDLRAHDDGLGLAAIGVARVILVGDQYWLGLHTPPCTGDRRGRCQTDFDTANDANFPTGRMQYRLDTLPEGLTELHASAHEISGGQYGTPAFAPTWTAKIDRTPPSVTPSGELYDLRDQYLNGQGTRALTVTASDALSGVASVDIEDVGRGNIAHQTISCSTTQCPTQATNTFNIDTSQMTEGRHQLRAVTTDGAGNTVAWDSWTVTVDRTAPGVATNLSATLDPDTAEADVAWNAAADPALADGTPGSGPNMYDYRVKLNSGGWTQANTQAPAIMVAGVMDTDLVTLEVTATDLAGNTGTTVTLTDVAATTPISPGNFGDPSGETVDGPVFSDSSEPDQPASSAQRASVATASSADYMENNCSSTEQCGVYDGRAAAAYAQYWYRRRNTDFEFFGNDCTNFISQAMKAGGMQYIRTGGRNDATPSYITYTDFYNKGAGSFWSARVFLSGQRNFFFTTSFVRADTSRRRLYDYQIGIKIGNSQRLRPGDLVYYKFEGINNPWSHASIISRVTKSGAYIAQHTTNRERLLADQIEAIRDEQEGRGRSRQLGVGWDIDFVRPTHTAYNLG